MFWSDNVVWSWSEVKSKQDLILSIKIIKYSLFLCGITYSVEGLLIPVFKYLTDHILCHMFVADHTLHMFITDHTCRMFLAEAIDATDNEIYINAYRVQLPEAFI